MFDTVILNGTVVTPTEIGEFDIGVVGEQIAAVGLPGSLGHEAKETIDARGLLVLPGGIDPHVHYSGPGTPEGGALPEPQEYSPAAAHGGVTTVIDFAFQQAGLTLHEAIALKREEADGRMAVDYGLHAGFLGNPSFEVLEEVGDVIVAGLPTFKTYMIYPGWVMDDGHFWGLMQALGANGGTSVVHAEDHTIVDWLTAKYLRENKAHGGYIVETRPPLVEEAAVRKALLLGERAGTPVYIVHLTSELGLRAISESRAKGLPVFAETTTPYLSFTQEKLWDPDHGLLWATTPPVKYADDQEALWQGLVDNEIQVVASDHFVVSMKDKYERMGTTVDHLMGGYEGVELRLPILFHKGVNEGRFDLRRFVELVSSNPAKIMGLYPRKGALADGADADIVILDPEKEWTVHWEDLHSSADYCPWEGWEIRGKVVGTLLRGAILVRNGDFVGSPTGGQFIPRARLDEAVRNVASAREEVETTVDRRR